MMHNDAMEFKIDWTLTREQFCAQISLLVKQASDNGKAIPLPVADDMAPLLVFLAALDCNNCHLCCTSVMAARLLDTELKALQSEYGKAGFTEDSLDFPCRFLSKHGCAIYAERPLVCMTFPLQDSSPTNKVKVLTVASDCPQARYMAVKVYMMAWDLSHKRKQIKEEAEILMKEVKRTQNSS